MPLASLRPNSSIVFGFGVAVNAKNDRFGDSARSSISAARSASVSISPPSSRSASSSAVRTLRNCWLVRPVWEECASSAMMANFLPARPLFAAISAIANGNVCIVTMMISLPLHQLLAPAAPTWRSARTCGPRRC